MENTNLDEGAASQDCVPQHGRQLDAELRANKTIDNKVDGAVENNKKASHEVEDVSQLGDVIIFISLETLLHSVESRDLDTREMSSCF